MGLIRLHIMVFWLCVGTAAGLSATSLSGLKRPSGMSACPFRAATTYLGRQADCVRDVPAMMVASADLSAAIPPTRLMTATFEAPSSSSRYSRYPTRLFATTADAEVKVAAEGNQDKKKKGKKKKKGGGGTDPLEVVVIGLSHHKASVDVREKMAIPEVQWNEAAAKLCAVPAIEEAAVLSTCNRFEVYLAGENQYDAIHAATAFFEERSGIDQLTLRENLFMLSGEDAIWHLLRVSAGLDSLVVGEGQILAQVKRAFEHGEEEDGQSGKVVARMLNTAVAAGKRVRSETGISKGAVSISSAAAEFSATKILETCNIEKMEDANVSIIGAGKMARLLLVHLQTQGVRKVTIVNRSAPRVDALREEFPDLDIELRFMPDMWEVIAQSDIVYPSTASERTIIDPPELAECLSNRARPGGLQLVDISVPRNVHKECGDIANVHSYNVDNLKEVVARNTAMRKKEMLAAEDILRMEMGNYRSWQNSLGAIPTIAALQKKAELLRLEEFEKASKKLSNLSPKDQEAVERLSKGIVAKLLHGPMNHLRQQTDGDQTIQAIDQVKRAFQLEQMDGRAK